MIIISAMSENRIIGSGKGMPWNVPAEYNQYLGYVGGNTVIMGRKTFEIFGADLPEGTRAIVLTRSAAIDGAEVASTLEEALELAGTDDSTVYVAGGGSVYAQAVPLADAMYLSTIKGDFTGDTYFPDFNLDDWDIAEERDEPEFIFRRYERKSSQ